MTQEDHVRPESLSRSMRIFLLLATLVIIAITIALTLKSKPKITESSLRQEIQSLQQQLPIQVDAQTQLTSVVADGMTIIYIFNVVDDPTQAAELSVHDNNFAQQLETSVKT